WFGSQTNVSGKSGTGSVGSRVGKRRGESARGSAHSEETQTEAMTVSGYVGTGSVGSFSYDPEPMGIGTGAMGGVSCVGNRTNELIRKQQGRTMIGIGPVHRSICAAAIGAITTGQPEGR